MLAPTASILPYPPIQTPISGPTAFHASAGSQRCSSQKAITAPIATPSEAASMLSKAVRPSCMMARTLVARSSNTRAATST